MDEPTNEYDGPNPLERFAECMKIRIENLEITPVIATLQAMDVEKYRKYVKRHHDRGTLREQREMIGRIAHELKRRPQMSAEGLAELLGCTADLVRTVKAKRSNGAR